ncbi:MAG TPA: DNA polymerase III subunit delta [Rhizomicrobium sp.]|nr:DNA polymerase III subunit delta [Rhizomicrobium sp.]
MTAPKAADIERFVDRPPSSIVAVLVFGPDRGLVTERANRLAKSVVPDLTDPFRVADLEEGTLDQDPARLADEAQALSMTGGRRVVRVRGAGNSHTSIFEAVLERPLGDALIVAEGGDLNKSSSLRKLFTEAENAAAIACYPDSARDIAEVVRSALKAEGLSIGPEALDDAVSRLGSDRGVTRRELDKLILYARGQKKIELEDIRAIMGDEAEARTEELCDAAGEGDFKRLDTALERLWLAETSPIQVVRAALGHFQRLALAVAEKNRGESIDNAMRKLRPPIHFSRVSSFKAQAGRWTEPKLLAALDLLLDAEALCKTTGVPGQAACGRALLNVAAMAKG